MDTTQLEAQFNRMLHRLLDHLAVQAALESESDRRDDRRQPVQAPVWLGVSPQTPNCGDSLEVGPLPQPLDPQASFTPLYRGWATDVSLAGVGMFTEYDLPTGVSLWINLESMADEPVLLPIRITYCKQILPHTHRVGAVFLFELQ